MFSYPEGDLSGRVYSASEGQGAVKGQGLISGLRQNNTSQGQNKFTGGQGVGQRYHGSKAWWSVGEHLHQGITHQSVGLSLGHNEEETWDLSDSLADLYQAVTRRQHEEAARQSTHHRRGSGGGGGRVDGDRSVDKKRWLDEDSSHGFIHVYTSDNESSGRIFPCTLTTTCQKICLQLAVPGNSLHVQMNGDVIRRMEPFDCPLAIQNDYLAGLGYSDTRHVQQEGLNQDLAYLIRFYSGKPLSDSTYARNQIQTYAYVRKGKLIHQWVRRWCVISGTRLLIHREKGTEPTVLQLAKGSVEEVQVKGQSLVLKLTSTYQGERSMYLSFVSQEDYNKWLRKIRKATVKLPSKADLSNCHLEFIPETVFINTELQILILRHNALRERPLDEDIYTIGWLDDLPRFTTLRSLNLADNQLMTFPMSLCYLQSLMELNLASNKLEEIPSQISQMASLQVLHLHNNLLTTLPDEMAQMRSLTVVVLAFNRFEQIPAVLLQSEHASFKLDSLIMAGNEVCHLPTESLSHMTRIKKIDLRLNKLQLPPTETVRFVDLEHITHVDVRENLVTELDLRPLRCMEYLNCEHNSLRSLQVNGAALKNIFASHNSLHLFTVSPKPEWLVSLTISHNQLTDLPSWLPDCFFLVHLDIQHNHLATLPDRLFTDAKRLKILKANHNQLTFLPDKIRTDTLEELHLQHNFIRQLSVELFIKAHRLRYLNMTRNKLCDLPPPNKNDSYNKLQELYLSFNHLNNRCLHKICCFPRLRVLHLARNKLSAIEETDIEKLEQLMELNVSSNNLTYLPAVLGRHPKLQVLRANCNLLRELPNFKQSSGIKVLEVSSNHLVNVNMTNLMASQMSLLDISANPNILVKSHDMDTARNSKKLCMVDMRGQNLSLEDVRPQGDQDEANLWQTGLSQTSGIRNKLSVTAINKPHFGDKGEALFAIFDGGRNEAVANILCDILPDVLREERARSRNPFVYLKYSFLSAHRNLKTQGQKLGASAAVIHLHKDDKGQHVLSAGNVGDVQVVLCRQKRAYLLSRKFVTSDNGEEIKRVVGSGGIITEDGRVSGVTYNTRLLGSSYLYPHVIPDPHVTSTTLTPEDTLFILASHGLWHYVSYEEAITEIMDIPDPVVAAKRLQDLAQGYGSRENISVLVVRLMLTEDERSRVTDLMVVQRSAQKELLKILSQQENLLQLRDGVPKVEELHGIVINKSGHAKKHHTSRKHLLDTRPVGVGSFLPPDRSDLTGASSKFEKDVALRGDVSMGVPHHDKVFMEAGMSHKKLRKELSEGNSYNPENDFSQRRAHLSVHSSSENSIQRLADYTSHTNKLLQQRRLDEKDDNRNNNDVRNSSHGHSPDLVRSRKPIVDYLPYQHEDHQLLNQERVVDDDDEDIFIPVDDQDVVHLLEHSQNPSADNESENSDRHNDFYYRMSPNEDRSVSPTESVSSIDVRVHKEADEAYNLRYIPNKSQIMSELKTNVASTKMYTSPLSESGQINQNEFYTRPLSPDSVISQEEFVKPPVNFANIDRDALLFHQMQMVRAQAQSGSITSLDSIQSAPMHASSKDDYPQVRSSSHSIEVLVNSNDNSTNKGLSSSLRGGRVVMGSSLIGNLHGPTTATSSCIATVGSETDRLSYSLKSFQKVVEADVHFDQIKLDRTVVDDTSRDDYGMDDSDNDTLVGDAEDLAKLEDFDVQKPSLGGQRQLRNSLTMSHVRRMPGQNLPEDVSSDSDSDESLGNVSLEDGYTAIQFSRINRQGSLSMNNVLDSDSEDHSSRHLATKYVKHKAKPGNMGGHFVKLKSGSVPSRTSSANRHQDETGFYETIDDGDEVGVGDKTINEYMDDINPYEDIQCSPPKENDRQAGSTATSLLRQASVSSEEDIDAFYATVNKIKRDELKETFDDPQVMDGNLQTFLPILLSGRGHGRDQTDGKNHLSPLFVSNFSRDEDEEREIFLTAADLLPVQHSSTKSGFTPAPSAYKTHPQTTQGPSMFRKQPDLSTFGFSPSSPSPGACPALKSSPVPAHKLSPVPGHKCNNPDTDRPIPATRSSSHNSNQSLKSFKSSATNLEAVTASLLHQTSAQPPPPIPPKSPYPQTPQAVGGLGGSSVKPIIPPKRTPDQSLQAPQQPAHSKPSPASLQSSYPDYRNNPNLVQSEMRSHGPSQSVLSSHELYPDSYQPSLSYCPPADITEAVSKLSSQKSISITYL